MKLRLQGLKPGEERPDVTVSAFDRKGKCLVSLVVDEDGTFKLPANVLKKAHRVRVGPGDKVAQDVPSDVYLTYRAVDFGSILEAGILDIGRGVWEGWFFRYRCVSGTVSRCRRSSWWHVELARAALRPLVSPDSMILPSRKVAAIGAPVIADQLSTAIGLDDLIAWPVRCSKICLGTVEVYRRVCCCEPWVFRDPRLDTLLEDLEDLLNGIPEIPDLTNPPGPGPDPGPYNPLFLRDGALDEQSLRANQDLQALRSMPAERVAEYINTRPYLLCRRHSCGSPVKVAEGTIGPDGRFNICWSEFPRLLRVGCHEKYAYKVKQKIGPFTVTIYNGVAAGHWYDQDDKASLKSYHPWAVACRDNGGAGDAFVYLDEIGDTDSSLLKTPGQTNATSVGEPDANDGLAFPAGGPHDGNNVHDRNWGGTLKLAIMFSESMRTIGAKYYRVSVTEADDDGNPVGVSEYVTRGLSWKKAVAVSGGVDVVPVTLGPYSTTAPDEPQANLYEIPFDGDLGTNADWEADQYHVYLNTNSSSKQWSDPGAVAGQPAKRHLVTIEIFDATGKRLRPNGTPSTGLPGAEIEAAFTFRRKIQDTGPTDMVPFGALTHLFWWDNRDVVASIKDLRMNGLESDEECQFLNGTYSSTFGIGYRAYHPWELFQRYHKISWKRGLSGGSDTMLVTSLNVGVPPAAVGAGPTHTFGHMLDHPVASTPPRTKCAFTVFLTTYNKRTDGDNLSFSWASDSAAFALDIAPTVCPPCPGTGDKTGG
ncbi:MAG TPA: hypothetical protein ENJ80_00785 [Gammaproteobacteria bacterium]|nr:hypothetical protein [Gammaproteobacteria bacterium]